MKKQFLLYRRDNGDSMEFCPSICRPGTQFLPPRSSAYENILLTTFKIHQGNTQQARKSPSENMRNFIWETVRYQGKDFEDVTEFLMDFLQHTSSHFQRNFQFTVAKVRTCCSNMDYHFVDEVRLTPSIVHLTREFIDQSMPEGTFSDYFTAHHLTLLKERKCVQCSSLAASYNIVKEYPPFIFIVDTQPYAGLPGNTSFP